MREFRINTEINASPEHVWNILADVRRWPEWTSSMSKVEPLDDGPLGIGSRVRVLQPKLRPAIMTIAEWQPGRGFVWVAKNPGLVAVAEHQLTPVPSGCVVALGVIYKGLLSSLVSFFAGSLTKRYIELEAAGLKARSEGKR